MVESMLSPQLNKAGLFYEHGLKWHIYVDGSSNKTTQRTNLIINGPDDFYLVYVLQFHFKVSNNKGEYETLITELRLA